MAIITTSQYKTYAGITSTAYDAQLNVIIPAVQDEFERFCGGRLFDMNADFAEYHDGRDCPEILVKSPPISAADDVTVQIVDVDRTVLYTYPTTSIGFDRTETGRIYLQTDMQSAQLVDTQFGFPEPLGFVVGSYFPKGLQNIKVTYTGGYDTASMPPSLLLDMYRLVDCRMASIRQDPTMQSETLGQYSYTRAGNAATVYGELLRQIATPWVRRTQ